MLRIVFIVNSLACGGAERHAVTLMNGMAALGHECHAVYVKSDATLLGQLRLGRNATVRTLNAGRYFDVRAVRELVELAAHVRPTVIVAANPYSLLYASLARHFARIDAPLVATFHSTRLMAFREWLKLLAERLCFWSADCTVFVCEQQRRYWRRRWVGSPRNEVIHNGVDTEQFCRRAPGAASATLRSSFGLRESDYVIGMVAGLRPEKNHLQLVEAVARLRRLGIAARALLVGEGEMRPAIEARARRLRVAEHIVLAGLQQDVRPFIAACDVMALCSWTEALSLAALEAMAMGKPVVHSQVGGAAEVITANESGFLFPAGDTAALVGHLATLANHERAAHMGANARRVIEARFSERTMLARYERLLLSLAADAARRLTAGGRAWRGEAK